jgi:tetratricopeptide (TPR) repeat protein
MIPDKREIERVYSATRGLVMSLILVCLVFNKAVSFSSSGNDISIKPDTSRVLIYIQSGLLKFRTNNYQGALNDFNKALTFDSTNFKIYRYKADAELKVQKIEEAIHDFSKAISLNRNDTLSFKGRGQAKFMQDKFQLALDDFNKGLSLNPQDYEMLFGKAESLFYLNKMKQAIIAYDSSINVNNADPLDYMGRGCAFMFDKQFKKAVDDFNFFIKLGSENHRVYLLRGNCYFQLHPNNILYADSAIFDLKKYLIGGRDKILAYSLLGASYAAKDDSVNSRKNFFQAAKLKPNDYESNKAWGVAELKFNENQKALELLNKAAGLSDDLESDFYYYRGLAKERLCDITGSLEDLNKATELDSLNFDARKLRLGIYFGNPRHKNDEVSLQDINYLIKSNQQQKNKSDNLFACRSLIMVSRNEFKEGLSDIEKAISLSPSNPMYYIVKGLIQIKANQDTEHSLSDYEKAIKLNKKLWQPYLAKAYLYREQKDLKKSCENLKKAIKHGAEINENISTYLCEGKETLGAGETALEFIPYSKIRSDINPTGYTVYCRD